MDVKKFLWKNIVTRFGIPHTLISDNGLQFDSKSFRRYCCELGITNRYSTPAYPQGNGQAEAVNKVIVSGLKKRLDDAKRRWVEEIPHVLWVYRTTPQRSTGETLFSMSYGAEAEAVIPIEIGFPTLRTQSFNPSNNDELLERSLNLIEERRESVMVQLAYYQHTQTRLRCQSKAKTTRAWRFGAKKGFRHGEKSNIGEIKAQLGRTLSYHLVGWYRSVFSRRFK